MLSQEQRILGDLLCGMRITSLMALHRYGSLRLSARIYNIRKRYKVHGKPIKVNGKWVEEYWLDKKHLRKAA